MSYLDNDKMREKIAQRIDPKTTAVMKIDSARSSGVAFADMDQVMNFARMMAVSDIGVRKHLRNNPGACLAVCIQAIEWEMSPFAVASKSYSVNDQIAYEAQLLNAVILRRAPIKGRFQISYTGEGPTRVCRVALAMRDGTPDAVYESPQFSLIQPKNSPLWKTDPDQQQFYNASRALCRRHFPDVLLGVYSVDELQDGGGPDDSPAAPQPPRQKFKGTGDRIDALVDGKTIEHEPEADPFDPPAHDEDGVVVDYDELSTHGRINGVPASNGATKETAAAPEVAVTPPQTAKSPDSGPKEGAGPQAVQSPGPALSDKDEAFRADLIATGTARAESGLTAFRAFLDDLTKEERGLLPQATVTAWVKAARLVKSAA